MTREMYKTSPNIPPWIIPWTVMSRVVHVGLRLLANGDRCVSQLSPEPVPDELFAVPTIATGGLRREPNPTSHLAIGFRKSSEWLGRGWPPLRMIDRKRRAAARPYGDQLTGRPHHDVRSDSRDAPRAD